MPQSVHVRELAVEIEPLRAGVESGRLARAAPIKIPAGRGALGARITLALTEGFEDGLGPPMKMRVDDQHSRIMSRIARRGGWRADEGRGFDGSGPLFCHGGGGRRTTVAPLPDRGTVARHDVGGVACPQSVCSPRVQCCCFPCCWWRGRRMHSMSSSSDDRWRRRSLSRRWKWVSRRACGSRTA